MGVVAVANATAKVYRATARQSVAMSMERWFRVRNAPSSARIGAVTVKEDGTKAPSEGTKATLLATACDGQLNRGAHHVQAGYASDSMGTYCQSQMRWSLLDQARQRHRGVL